VLAMRSKLDFIASVIKYWNQCHSGECQNPGKQNGCPRLTACEWKFIKACPQLDWGSGITDVSYFIAGILTVALVLYIGCTNSNHNKFRNKISSMSDSELLAYYHGINDRLKDIEHGMAGHESIHHPRVTDKHYIYQTPFLAGGEGYHLIRNRKIILQELRKRNIYPHSSKMD